MVKVAVIEDDQPTSQQLCGWIAAARPGIQVDTWFTRDEAEAALENLPRLAKALPTGVVLTHYTVERPA